VSALRTSYEFTLPRGYVDGDGRVHRSGQMRLATARDELEPLRDPLVQGPDDPRLTILVLTRVIEGLGDLELVNTHVIEGLFAIDLAFLQDFYGVINFGNQEEYDALVNAQAATSLVGVAPSAPEDEQSPDEPAAEEGPTSGERPNLRRAVEEMPRKAQ